jgi:hypothetical protein
LLGGVLALGAGCVGQEPANDDQALSPDAGVLEKINGAVTRGPYLQLGREDGVTIRWRTKVASDSVVRYGNTAGTLDRTASVSGSRTEHKVTLKGLSPETKYYYSVGRSSGTFEGGGPQYYFKTHPPVGSPKPFKIWVIGDSGHPASNNGYSEKMYEGFRRRYGGEVGVWLMLGDNAYEDGTDSQFQRAVFDVFPPHLRNTILWSTRGNHERSSSVYYGIFDHPTNGEAGGVASGTEAYYSFDYGNVHFVCLDSQGSDRSASGAQARWLRRDLEDTDQQWIVAFFHHPPYTKGTHDSDTEAQIIEMRENFNPILEENGVDLVLGGHSHGYERSYLIDGHYGHSSSFSRSKHIRDASSPFAKDFGPHDGAVYVVEGSSSHAESSKLPDHPAHQVNQKDRSRSGSLNVGSLLITANGDRLVVERVLDTGSVADRFVIVKSSGDGGSGDGGTGGGGGTNEIRLDVKDTFVASDVPTQNFGAATPLQIDGSPSVRHALLRPVSLSAIPAGAKITKAELVVTVIDGGNNMAAHRVTSFWSETTLTHNGAPLTGPVFATVPGSLGTQSVDVTSIVREWVNGAAAYGIALLPGGTNGVDLHSSEHATPAERPYFRVTVER